MKYETLTVRFTVIKESDAMDLKRELPDYEIGGLGDIKKHNLRLHSYRIGTESGKPVIYAVYKPEKPPEVFKGYPAGQ